jgi:hypothetical protein
MVYLGISWLVFSEAAKDVRKFADILKRSFLPGA